MDLPSVLGGLAQGFTDFGKSVVDLFGTGGAAIGDLLQGTGTRNQDDFRKWLYNTDSVQDAAAKGLGTALNGVQTVSDYIPGINVLTRNPLGNAAQGALGGLADEFKMNGENYDLGRAGQRAAVSGAAALAGSSLGDALKKSANPLLQSGLAQGLARGAAGGAINQGGYAAIDGGDVWDSALQGAGMGALFGGATGLAQELRPHKLTPAEMALTDEERRLRIANAQDMLANEQNPERIAELNEQIKKYGGATAQPDYLGDEKYSKLVKKAKGYKSLDRFEKMNNPIKGSEIWGEKPKSYFERDSRAVRINMFPNDATKGTGLTKQYLLNMFKDAYDDGITDIVPSYGSYTKEGASFMNHLADQGWVKQNGRNGYNSYEIAPKIAEWQKTNPLADIYNAANSTAPKALETTLADADMAVNSPKLTPEQEAYFKDSVIRDENGNLMPMYHGSRSKFTVFDNSKGGESNKMARVGHWFTPNEQGARRFADQTWYGDLDEPEVYNTYLNMKKPKIYEPIDNSEQINSLQNSISDLRNKLDYMRRGTDEFNETYKKYNDLSKQLADLSYGDPYEQFRSDVYAMEGKSPEQANVGGIGMIMDDEKAATQKYVQNLRDQGYDGILIRGTNYDNGTLGGTNDQYVVFDSNQIKDINNLNPTGDPDIRYSKAASGQSLEKTLANGDAEINRVGSANVAPVDTKTLPKSLQAAQEYLNEGNYIKDIENFAGKPYPKLTNQDYLDYAISLKNPKDREFYESIIKDMVDDGTTTYEKYAASAARNNRLNKLRMGSYDDIDPKALASYIANHRQALSNGTIRDVDAELSDRLGIGRSNTLMMDNNLPPDALGAYDPTNSTISIDTNAPEENLVNTLAHERLHSFQTEGDFKRYDKRVTDAYEELSKDLNKYLKTPEETAKRYAFDTDYWGNEREQQSRMLQQYLENKGFTRGGLQKSNAGEWGNEINPAFDKFFDKLRDLSKRGVALPALAGLLGGGVVLDQVLNSKDSDKDKKKTKRSA